MQPDTNIHDLQQHNPLHAHQPGEQILCNIKRHPIGIITIYFSIAFVIAAMAAIIFIGLPAVGFEGEQVNYLGTVVMLLASIFGVLYALVAQIIYWGNKWVVTSDSVTHVVQKGLFSKQSSQLALDDIESVSAEKNGLLMQMFNYGVLKAETAGEHQRFVFLYCPKPEEYARQILMARELFMAAEKAKEVSHAAAQQPAASAQPAAPTVPPAPIA